MKLISGSLGEMIAYYYSSQHQVMSIEYFGIDDYYVPQGDIKTLLEYAHISLDDLLKKIEERLNEKRKS